MCLSTAPLCLVFKIKLDGPKATFAQTLDFIQGHLTKIQSYNNRVCFCNELMMEILAFLKVPREKFILEFDARNYFLVATKCLPF